MTRSQLLTAPDGTLVRSLVFDDGSEALESIDPAGLPPLPALFASELDAITAAELQTTLTARTSVVRPRPVLELVAGRAEVTGTLYEVVPHGA